MKSLANLSRLRVVLTLLGVTFIGSCTPRYSQYQYAVDRRLQYTSDKDFNQLLLNELDGIKNGVEITVEKADLQYIRRSLKKWMAAIRETEGKIYDPDDAIQKYRLQESPKPNSKLSQIAEYLSEKTQELLNTVDRNRRNHLARKVNLTIRARKDALYFYFVRRK